MTDAARSSSRMGWLPLGPLGARRRSSDRESTGSGSPAQPRGRLFRKYVLLIVGLVSLVLLLNSALDFWFSYEENKTALFRIQQEKVASTARRIEQFVDEIERQLGWTTAPQWAASPLEQRRFDYVRLLRQVPAITELIQLDDTGKEQLKVSRLAMDVVGSEKDYSQSPSFVEAKKHSLWFSPVYFRKESEPYLTMAVARAGRNAGVTVAEVNLKLIWDVITGLKIGQSGYAYVVDREGRLIAHPDISLVLRNTDLANLPQVASALTEALSLPSPAVGGGSGWGQPIDQGVRVAKGVDGKPVLTAHAAIAPLGWTVFVELPLNEALAPLYGSMLRTAALLALALVLATLAALVLARRMTVPIRELQAGAARIGAGELDRHIDIHTGDELEDLAGDFNRMAGDLQKSYAGLEKKVEDRTAELKEALEQQTATAEVLQVINSSPGDLTPIFDAMLEKAHALCGAPLGSLVLVDGAQLRAVATRGYPQEYERMARQGFSPTSPFRRLLSGEPFVHALDPATPAAPNDEDPMRRAAAEIAGIRTALFVSLRKDATVLGYISAQRQEVRPFTDKQIALLQNFAAQAVIAIENARLLTETREALEQQTATTEVLQVINSSPGDLQPVFDVILEKARDLCGFVYGSLNVYDGEYFRTVATRGYPDAFAEVLRQPRRSGPQARFLHGERIVHILDTTTEEAASDDPVYRAAIEAGVRTVLFVPLRSETRLLGYITANRREVRPFSEKEIALLENFAAQAVIAMENARLITETREALEQQTATAEVLQVINSSPGNLSPVFDAILEKAHSRCGAAYGSLHIADGEAFRAVAVRGMPEAFADFIRRPFQPGPNHPLRKLIRGEPFAVVINSQEFDDPMIQSAHKLGGMRTGLFVPLRKEDVLLGYIVASRPEVRPFSDKQIALLQNFAAQAVIAMENARLITETHEALEQQTATAEVLQVINSSPGDLAPVFDAILEKAHTLCEAAHGGLVVYDGQYFRGVAERALPVQFAELLRKPFRAEPESFQERLLQGDRLVHIPDVTALDMAAEDELTSRRRQAAALAGIRTLLFLPLRKDQTLLGYISAYRREVSPFTDNQIALLENFAAQAVIAMENARLITETREALEQQTATTDVLQVINSSPGDLAPVFDAMLEKAMRLCEADVGNFWTYDGEAFTAVAMRDPRPEQVEWARQRRRGVPGSISDSLIRGESVIHIPDAADTDAYRAGEPARRAIVDLNGGRTLLAVALRKGDELLGYITIFRRVVRPFSHKQIALLQNFAAQAVIAMENVRLITETREALEQQTATAEVLQVINSSPGDLAPVFDAILEKAHTLCGAAEGRLLLYDHEHFRAVAVRGVPEPFADRLRQGYRGSDTPASQPLMAGARFVHIPDLAEVEHPMAGAAVEHRGNRTLLSVPLRNGDALFGMIVATRQEVRPFSDKQIALLQNFAAQAVIAMENARLITETREALEQQTATAEVLQVINSSPGELAPVFDAMLDKAIRLCEATHGHLFTYDGECFHPAAVSREPSHIKWARQGGAIRPVPNAPLGRLSRGERVVHITDVQEEDVYRTVPALREQAEIRGIRSQITVGLFKDNTLLGAMVVYRQEVRPFTDKQIALLQNFAAQAVIAMENARLITETREALEQQTATAEVLRVISSSPADLQPTFDAIAKAAATLCDAANSGLFRFDGSLIHFAAQYGLTVAQLYTLRNMFPLPPGPGSITARAIMTRQVVHVPDSAADPQFAHPSLVQAGLRGGVSVPMLRAGEPIGAITVTRPEIRSFTDKQIALLQSFAAQAVIAMENARLITETREALEQQTATAEVLQVINSSPGDLAPVFDAMLEKALRLCGGSFGELRTYDGNRFRLAATQGVPTAYLEHYSSSDSGIYGPGTGPARILAGERVVHIPDLIATEPYQRGDPDRVALVDLGGARAYLLVPLLKDGAVLGYIMIYRMEVGPFSDKQTALLQNFAAQAVIAMENARLITETREALEQQTATAEVLGVINSSPGDLAPVIDAMLEKAMRLCEADFGGLWAFEGERYVAVAQRGVPKAYSEFLANTSLDPPGPGTGAYRLRQGELVVHNIDLTAEEVYRTGEPNRRALVDLGGARTALQVPLRKDDAVLGVITIYRQEVRPFTDQQITLVQNFAAQAVIAMENARLLTETREALEQQTATAEVLQVINSSPGDLAPVFDTILQKAHSLCGIAHGSLQLYEDGQLRAVAMRGVPEPLASRLRQPHPLGPGPARLLAGGRFHQLTERAEESAWAAHGIRTRLFVPLRQDEAFLGMIVAGRDELRAFSDKEIALLENFAAQAVIAMENARLLTETREALEQQTATAEVLQVINSSPGDLAPVFDAMLEKATHLCEASFGVLCTYDGASFRATALREVPAAYARFLTAGPLQPGPGNGLARVAAGEKVVHVLDVAAEDTYRSGETLRRALVDLGGARTTLTVALPKDDALLGAFIIYRHEVRPFTEKQIALVQNFAAQAVIAMENVRLITELRQRTHDLQESLEYQTASSDVLKVISRSGAELGPVLDTLVETAAHICRADSGFIFRLQDGLCRMVAGFGIPAEYKDFQERNPIAPGRGTLAGRTVLERRAVHIDDAATDPEYTRRQAVQQGRQRTMLGVPLIRDDMLIGVITLARSYVEPFSEKQIGLVTTFADQAVIAIENARLFNELRTRTAELGSSVAELKMLSEVGQAVSSTLDLRTVLSTILNASLGVTWANAGAIFRYIRAERAFRLVEAVGWDEPLLRSVRDLRVAEAETAMGEAAARRTPIQLAELAERPSAPLRDASLAAGFHSALIVPLVGAERILGAIILMRQEAGEFPAETVRLMQTLASQSVLAIQNARLFREIADKSEQLALASQHKSQFLANMSHELRTPLNAILGYAELLVDGIYGVMPDRPRGVLDRIQNNGKHLLALINDVLDLAKIEAGQLTLTLEDYSVAEVVKSVVTATEPLATSKGLKFTAVVQENLPMAHGDARRVSQVLLNLVGNALKFSDKGEVEIRAIVDKGQFVLTVRDTGPGIADADQDRIFGEFQQIDNSNTRKKGGTGLGLAISKRMVEIQGGTISVDSVLGEGSTFRVVLPVHVDEMMEAA